MEYLEKILEIIKKAEKLGARELADGTNLIGHVPLVAPEAFLHIIFRKLNDLEIAKMEKSLQRKLPSELKEFYREMNGLEVFSRSLTIYGSRENYARTGDLVWQPFSILERNVFMRVIDAPDDAIFFGSYCQGRCLLFTSYLGGKVYGCSRDDAKPLNEWRDFPTMLLDEVKKISSQFDDQGNMIREHGHKSGHKRVTS
jgi:hypothetical protein